MTYNIPLFQIHYIAWNANFHLHHTIYSHHLLNHPFFCNQSFQPIVPRNFTIPGTATRAKVKWVSITYLFGTRSCIHVNNMVLTPPSHHNYSPPTMSSSTSISSLCFRSPPSTTTVLPLYNSKKLQTPPYASPTQTKKSNNLVVL